MTFYANRTETNTIIEKKMATHLISILIMLCIQVKKIQIITAHNDKKPNMKNMKKKWLKTLFKSSSSREMWLTAFRFIKCAKGVKLTQKIISNVN